MTTLAALILAVLWWLILRRPTSALPQYLTRRWQDTLPVEDRNQAYLRAWEDRPLPPPPPTRHQHPDATSALDQWFRSPI